MDRFCFLHKCGANVMNFFLLNGTLLYAPQNSKSFKNNLNLISSKKIVLKYSK